MVKEPAGPVPVVLGEIGTCWVREPSVMVMNPSATVVPKVVTARFDPGGGALDAPMATTARTGTSATALRPGTGLPSGPTYTESVKVTCWVVHRPKYSRLELLR